VDCGSSTAISCWKKSSDATIYVPAIPANASSSVVSRKGVFDGVTPIESLDDLPLTTFCISSVDLQWNERVVDTDLSKLSGLGSLQELNLSYTPLTNRHKKSEPCPGVPA
jgi:hypothetical protein